jgi:beta-barrel assembly-enhancing protease
MRMIRLLPVLAAVLALAACGVNPVTGKKELQFISETQEIQIGQQHYAPTRQGQGGDFVVLPELTTYVSEVGQKLAAVAERPLPYEFVVLNSSVPNAWALPGGKIAVNRGLLTTLENEAELAAVLGHEIVHAAARHGAQAQERGTLLQIGMVAASIGVAMSDVDPNLGNLMVQGAGVGAQLIAVRYGREAELESDLYGMRYLRQVGYDPAAAVTLQEKFLALSQQDGRSRSWLEGLFASHPPSAERVERNRATAAELGTGGELGAARYAQEMAPLKAIQPAYDQYDQALVAARAKDYSKARSLAQSATQAVPREGRFQQLLGDLAMAEKQPARALPYYEKAVSLDPGYFGAYLGGGVAYYQTGDRGRAEGWLKQSVERLPTAPAMYYLGTIAKDSGNVDQALQYYRAAAGSQSEIGQRAAAEFAAIDVGRNPATYVAVGGQQDAQGRVLLRLQNRAPVALTDIIITPVQVDAAGRVVQQGRAVRINRVLKPGEQLAVDAGIGVLAQEQLPAIRFRVDRARAVETR